MKKMKKRLLLLLLICTMAQFSCQQKGSSLQNKKLLVQLCDCGKELLGLNEKMQRFQLEGKQDSLLLHFDILEEKVIEMEACAKGLIAKHGLKSVAETGLASQLKKTCPNVHKALLDKGQL